MTNPAVIIVTGVVVAFAAVIAVIAAASNKEKPMSHDRRRRRSPPPSTSPSFTHYDDIPSTSRRRKTCQHCHLSTFIKVNPCNHESLCRDCFKAHLETNDTCPDCSGRIDGCSPPIPPFGKCKECKQFTKLFKFLPCNHSLSICISCFEEQNCSYKKCPQCDKIIRGSEPIFKTSGICGVCDEFTHLAKFQPCGHAKFCRPHAAQYLRLGDNQCNECNTRVTKFV